MKVKEVNLYTDGSSIGNPGPGGYGIILDWVGMSYTKEFSAGFARTTNNRMELMAVIKGLEFLNKQGMQVIVYSDSKYVIDAVEKKWLFNWEKKDFRGKKNIDLWRRFLKVYKKHEVRFQWINDDEDQEDKFFEFNIEVHDITKDVSLLITDFCPEDEMEESKMLWENLVSDLKQVLGST